MARRAQRVSHTGNKYTGSKLNSIECIAQYTGRPLMVLTSSDIGTDPKVVEENLTRNFKQAYRWNAVLLIDEADVFMERRSTADLTRNSLVAGEVFPESCFSSCSK